MSTPANGPVREDFREIARLVRPGARVLDVGCGAGELLDLLRREKAIDGRGLEIGADNVAACLSLGIPTLQGDADRDLSEYPDGAFDYAILSQTLQAVMNPRKVLGELMRLADRAIVSFPNFGHWRVRWSLISSGRMPETRALPEPWWATANIHLCTLRDFIDLCAEMGLTVEAASALAAGRPARAMKPHSVLEGWRAESALFMLRRTTSPPRPATRDVALPSESGDLFGR